MISSARAAAAGVTISVMAAGSPALCQPATSSAKLEQPTPMQARITDVVDTEEPAEVPSGFSAKLDVGPAIRALHGHALWGGELQTALGMQFTDVGALYVIGELGIGETDQGLGTFMVNAGPAWEFVVGRFRPGLAALLHYVAIDRATRDSAMTGGGASAALFGTVDLVQSDHVNLYLGLSGSLGFVSDDLLFAGGTLRLGSRFKVP